MTNQLAVKEYMHQDAIVKGFADVLGNSREANAYISSVLIAVANSTALQDCTPISIVSSAMRAATLRLSCDPGIGKAYLVPFKNNATLVIGYKGLIDLALRTGQYRYLNVSPIYEGEIIGEDRLTGIHTIADGGKKSNTVIGYLAYLKMVSGFEKTIYMTIEEIAAHAQRYSKNYNSERSIWKTHAREMEKKTVLRQLLTKWGYFDPHDSMMISKLEEADEIIDGEIIEQPADKPDEPRPSAAQINAELGYDQLMPPEYAELYEMVAEQKPAGDITVDLAHLAGIVSQDGTAYLMIDSEKLANMSKSIANKIAKNGLSDKEKAEAEKKQAAIGEILAWRNAHA